MFNSTPDPIAISLGSFDIRWYGIFVTLGILTSTILIYLRAPKFNINRDSTLDMFLWAIPCGIVGARLYYVIFQWDYYSNNLISIIRIDEGGLAIHGGLIFGGLALLLVCNYHKIKISNCLDLFAPAVVIGQAIGRWGNYFNMEAHGGPTDLPWAIPVNGEMVHPTFLYESLWCALLFIFLIIYENRRKFEGQIFLLYGFLYSLERFFVEGLRTDSLMFGPLRQAQFISLLSMAACLIIYIILIKKQKNKVRS